MIRTHAFELGRVRQSAYPTLCVCVLLAALCIGAAAQDTVPAHAAANQNDTLYKFKADVNQVLVRVVVRDSEGQLMAARNGSVDIP